MSTHKSKQVDPIEWKIKDAVAKAWAQIKSHKRSKFKLLRVTSSRNYTEGKMNRTLDEVG